jgi:hypothetical protein
MEFTNWYDPLHITDLAKSCQNSQTLLSARKNLLNRISSQDLNEDDDASTDPSKKLKSVDYWKDVFDAAWKAYKVTQRRPLLILSVA